MRQPVFLLQIRDAVRDGTGPFAPPKKLARHASFAWDTSPGGSWGSFSDKPHVSASALCIIKLAVVACLADTSRGSNVSGI